jgi:hypothetical protein
MQSPWGWPDSSESPAELDRNRWPLSFGLHGHFRRNTQHLRVIWTQLLNLCVDASIGSEILLFPGLQVDPIAVPVLIAALVLPEQDVFTGVSPLIPGDTPVAVGGDGFPAAGSSAGATHTFSTPALGARYAILDPSGLMRTASRSCQRVAHRFPAQDH